MSGGRDCTGRPCSASIRLTIVVYVERICLSCSVIDVTHCIVTSVLQFSKLAYGLPSIPRFLHRIQQ